MRRRRNIGCGRSGPLGLRRPDSDELVGPILVRPPIRAIRRWRNPGRIVIRIWLALYRRNRYEEVQSTGWF